MLKDKPPKKSKFRQNIRDFRFYVKVSEKKECVQYKYNSSKNVLIF